MLTITWARHAELGLTQLGLSTDETTECDRFVSRFLGEKAGTWSLNASHQKWSPAGISFEG
jgi:hypothetical protein